MSEPENPAEDSMPRVSASPACTCCGHGSTVGSPAGAVDEITLLTGIRLYCDRVRLHSNRLLRIAHLELEIYTPAISHSQADVLLGCKLEIRGFCFNRVTPNRKLGGHVLPHTVRDERIRLICIKVGNCDMHVRNCGSRRVRHCS